MSILDLPEIFQSKTPKTYKSKKLNNASFIEFNHNDYQVFLHLISKIAGVDEYGKYLQPKELQREHILTAREFSEVFNVSLSNCYGVLKRAIDKLMKTDIRIEKTDGSGFCRINVCSMADYNKHEGNISVKFTDDIMPYLAQVTNRFVLYNIKEISNFGSLYTTRLYELIQEFKETGWLLISVDQLREVFAVGNKFKTYNNFKQKTFAHACREINNNYDMGLRFEELKEGRKVVAVKFYFKKTVVTKVTNQKTGKVTNIYSKPKTQINIRKNTINDSSQKTLDTQLSFDDLKSETKPMKNILSSLFEKFITPKK
jgi:plasmid replication initiation protein